MKPLDQYPISFPYNAITEPYTPSHPHRGNDRAAPKSTPIYILDTLIGTVGRTGKATGYHCHTQEWYGSFANVRKPQNEFKPGVVTQVGFSFDFGNYVTITNSDGWNTSYCHLERRDVTLGQIIGENVNNTPERVKAVFKAYLQSTATQNDINYWVNRPTTDLDDTAASTRFARDAAKIKALESQQNFELITTPVYKKKG